MSKESYIIYSTTYGRVKSGTKLTEADYCHPDLINGNKPFNIEETTAVTLACEDASIPRCSRSVSEFEERIAELLK